MKGGTAISGAEHEVSARAVRSQVRSQSRLLSVFIRPVSALLDFWLESPCLLCQRSTAKILCQTCQQRAQTYQHPQLLQSQSPPNNLAVFAWGDYRGDIQRMMRLLKYENQPKIGTLMGQWLALAWLAQRPTHLTQIQAIANPGPIIVPIPLHHNKLQQRGYNQAELIAQEFCRITQLRLVSQGLERIQDTQPQFSLSAQQRFQNLNRAFQVTDTLKQYRACPILLLDDIHTTGATTRSATQALQQTGFNVLGVIAVAKTNRNI